jgi:hypothetical protein
VAFWYNRITPVQPTDPISGVRFMRYLRLTITDVLSVWDDLFEGYVFAPDAASRFRAWYRLPNDWVVNEALAPDRRELILQHLYGEDWRSGNVDGSQYRTLDIEEHFLDPEEIASQPWRATKEPCYVLGANETLIQRSCSSTFHALDDESSAG